MHNLQERPAAAPREIWAAEPNWQSSSPFRGSTAQASSGTRCVAPKLNFLGPNQCDLPCSDFSTEKFRFSLPANQLPLSYRPVPHEGRFAIVTNVGMGCGGRDSAVA
jgi:hypothetical protein